MLKPYEEYKEVNAVWLNKIPSHWNCEKLGMNFTERRTKVSDKDYPPLSVTKRGVVPQLENAAKSNDGDNRKLVLSGDFVINSRSDRKGSSGLSKLDGSVSLINIVLKPRTIFPTYSHYLFKSYDFVEEFYRNGRGIVADLWTTRYWEMRNILIPIPPLNEQEQIVKYLDSKLSKINSFIKTKKKLITLLTEQKQVVINEAVTKGINPNVNLKPSGVEWLGDIPEHWEIIQSRRLFTQRNEKIRSDDIQLTASQKYGIIRQEDFMRLEKKRVTVVFTGSDILKHVEPNDFVISMRSFQGGLEYSSVRGCISSAYVMLIPNDRVEPEYFKWLFKSASYIRALQSTSNLVRDGQALRFNNFAQVPLVIFDKEEQLEIARYILENTQKIESYISKIEKEITLITEYRTRIISDVVTGKVDVSNVDISEAFEEYIDIGDIEEELEDNEEVVDSEECEV